MSRGDGHRHGTDTISVAVGRAGLTLTTTSPDNTQATGRQLGGLLTGGEVIGLTGDLGTGKTCLIQGLAAGLGVDPATVTSPTFVFMHHHRGRLPFYHMDLYRIAGPPVANHGDTYPVANHSDTYPVANHGDTYSEAEAIGLFETIFSEPGAVAAIEWADRAEPALPPDYLMIRLEYVKMGRHGRRLHFEPRGSRYIALIERLRPLVRRRG